MIKPVAVVVGLLFLISCTYYLAFWGSFDIDIFQYIQVTDIIKGVAYPFRIPGVWLLIAGGETAIALSIVLLERDDQDFQDNVTAEIRIRNRRETGDKLYLLMKLLLFLAFLTGSWHYVALSASSIDTATVSGVISIPLIAAAFVASYATADYRYRTRKIAELIQKNKQPKLKNGLKKLLDYATIACVVYFLVNALSLGLIDARKIKEDIEYNYVTDSRFLGDNYIGDKRQLIYLGTISNKLFFTYKNSEKHFIVNNDKVGVLSLCHYKFSKPKVSSNDINLMNVFRVLLLIYDLITMGLILCIIFYRKWLINILDRIKFLPS